MPKVFILNRGAHDYSAAARYGDLVYISDGMLPKLSTGTMYRLLDEAFQGSSSEDLIVLSSLSTLCSIATALFATLHGRINLLIYTNDSYVLRQINFSKDSHNV